MGTTVARPIAIDLFSGAGGLSLGLEQAGFDVRVAVEYDPVHAATHTFNFPECKVLCRDIRTVSGDELVAAARAGRADDEPIAVVVGGPSCQGFSTGGTRLAGDERNQLLLEFVRLVGEIRPQAFILENVSGLLENRFDSLRRIAWKRLRDHGYALSGVDGWVDAHEYGVAQRRKRVVVLGVLDGPPAELPEGTTPGLTVADALAGLPTVEDYPQLLLADSVRLSAADLARRLDTTSPHARILSGLTADPSSASDPREWDPEVVTGCLRTVHVPATVARFEATDQGRTEPKSRLFRLDPSRPARTLRAGSAPDHGSHTSPRPIHPYLPRAITVREAARLHAYPDWFRFHGTNWHGHRQIGNSVPPPLARAAAAAVMAALGRTPRKRRKAIQLGPESLLKLSSTEAARVVQARTSELPAKRTRTR